MSRSYKIDIEVKDFNAKKTVEILTAIGLDLASTDKEDSFYSNKDTILYSAYIDIGGGMDECDHFEELMKDIWKVNEAYCKVKANYTYLEDLPSEDFESMKEEYNELMGIEEPLTKEESDSMFAESKRDAQREDSNV